MHVEEIGREIVDACYQIYRDLGPGLLERVYEKVLVHELRRRGLKVEQQVSFDLEWRGLTIKRAFRVDVLVEDTVLIEVKSVEYLIQLFHLQTTTYVRLSRKPLGYLVNFNSDWFKDNIHRKVWGPMEGKPYFSRRS